MMTKHEFNIALVLLALITAGVLGYHALNTPAYQPAQNCTLALYFSGPDGCYNQPAVDAIPASSFLKSIERYFSAGSDDLPKDVFNPITDPKPSVQGDKFQDPSGENLSEKEPYHDILRSSKPKFDSYPVSKNQEFLIKQWPENDR